MANKIKTALFEKRAIALIAGMFLGTAAGHAAEPDPWEDKPQIQHIFFSQKVVGFASNPSLFDPMRGKSFFFIFDRQNKAMKEVAREEFNRAIPEARSLKLPNLMDYWDWRIDPTPKSSSGEKIDVEYVDHCGGDIHCFGPTKMRIRSTPFTLDLGAEVISAMEIVEDRAWLGTEEEGGYRYYGGRGIIVIDLKSGKETRVITAANGLSGDLIHLIRKDTYSPSIWTATNYGIDELGQDGKIKYQHLFKPFNITQKTN